jgi:putative membrane protein
MARGRSILSDEDRAEVNRAVQEAESLCSAEIVPVIARASGRYDRAEDLAGFVVALLAMSAAWVLLQREDPGAGGWDGLGLTLPLWALLSILVAGFAVGALVASRVGLIRRLLTPAAHRRAEVAARARAGFFDARVHHTRAAGGLLIYVSLEERLALLLADEAVLGALGQEGLDALRDGLLAGLRRREPVALVLAATIREAGRRLGPGLPAAASERNELPDAVVILE